MALFALNKATHEGKLNESLMVFHKSQPLLATAWSAPASVLITNNEGEVLTVVREPSNRASAVKPALVSALAWHPIERLLVIGWSSGMLLLWSMPMMSELGIDDGDNVGVDGYISDVLLSLAAKAATLTNMEDVTHGYSATPVLYCDWSSQGQYLMTSCGLKTVTMWELEWSTSQKSDDAHNTLLKHVLRPLWFVETPNPIVKAAHVFGSVPSAALKVTLNSALREPTSQSIQSHGKVDASLRTVEDNTVFFLLSDDNSIFILTEERKLIRIPSKIGGAVSFLYDPNECVLVTCSINHMIEVYRIAKDLSAESLFRKKLQALNPHTTTPGKLSLSLVDSGVVAISSGDDRIRVLDIRTEAMHAIPFPRPGSHIQTIACITQKKTLIAGTTEGTAAVFIQTSKVTSQRTCGRTRTDDAAERIGNTDNTYGLGGTTSMSAALEDISAWEALAIHNFSEPIDRIELNPLGDIAACTAGAHLQVLHETERHRAWDGAAAATQISTTLVVIESVTGCQCLLNSKTKVRGLAISFPNIALWNGFQIDIYTINESNSDFALINFVPTTSPAFALHQEGLLYVKDGRIVFMTLQLRSIGQLAFTAAEGVPVVLNIMKDFVVAISSKKLLRLARITSKGLQPSGPSRPFKLTENEAEMGNITVVAARVNAQGRRVALMAKVGPFQVPDTRIWVFDADTDKVVTFDFAERNEVPDAVYWNTPEPNTSTIGELEYLLLACETHQVHNKSLLTDVSGEAFTDDDDDRSSIQVKSEEGRDQAPGSHLVHREGYAEPMPDVENFAEKREPTIDWGNRSLGVTNSLSCSAHNLVTLFATRSGLAVHNSVPLKAYQICLVGLTIPDFLLSSVKIDGDPSNPQDYVVEQKRLRDFDGLHSDNDVVVREALMKFSYYSTIGNMDEAYRCMKTIKDPAAWQSLARMCVSNGRLDVAAVCLAVIGDGVAARALREAKEDYPNDKNIQLASLACSMGLLKECEKLLRASKQYGLITDVFLACGKFERAQQHSERYDRIHIRPVTYKYAQFMESLKNVDAAIIWYYNAHCAGTDVPRIFYNYKLHKLRELMDKGGPPKHSPHATSASSAASEEASGTNAAFASLFPNNTDLIQWWAKYSERRRDAQEAFHFYSLSGDVFNQVRVLCGLMPPKVDKALELVDREIEKANAKFQRYQQQQYVGASTDNTSQLSEPDHVGAAFFIAQYYERERNVEKALQYYRHAGAYYSGARLSRMVERDNDCFAFALASGDERLMLESALYLSEKGLYSKAVELYRKIGAVQCALGGCIKGGLFDTLHEISTKLADNSATSDEVFIGMADHFQSTGDYSKAVEMLVFAKHYDAALQLCQNQNVTLTEAMAESMTSQCNSLPAEEKQALLHRIARIAKEQGSWNLACRKYTQAGDRLKAMKMLMRSGDVDKVIFFANHSRNAEIYTLAGNFLQSQNWSVNLNVYKSIVLFYTKAKSFDSLLAFYDSCMQFHIDENRNYEEALRVLDDAVRTLEKATVPPSSCEHSSNISIKLADFQKRGQVLQSFVKAQGLMNTMNLTGSSEEKKVKSDQIIKLCSDIIKRSRPGSPDHDLIGTSLRVGDVFALLVHLYFDKLGEPRNALKVLESMPKHNIEPHLFLEVDFMEKVCLANSKHLASVLPRLPPSVGAATKAKQNAEDATNSIQNDMFDN